MNDTPETDEIDRRYDRESQWYAYLIMQTHARSLERERNEWREKAQRLQAACNKWSEDEILFTHCQNCKEFRGHGHQCKSEPPEPPARNCRECCGQGQVEIQSGPYMTQCPECDGTGKQNNQPKP
jgi:DnaJ-class molecular chaperone